MNHDNDNHIGASLRFLSVCSGIEAASVAWEPLGWQAVAFSEIEKFPSAVLAHHYPDVPNLGDFTKIDTITLGQVDILCGGTPCQAFSVAGLRGGLNDARGNLTLAFVELAHELAAGNGLRNAVWENVVGVLSDKTGAFGCFLAGLVGAASAIEPPTRGKWGSAGLVSGPKGRAAWRIQDAQHHGLAQRRRRVLVVADFGNGADPAQVLFELEGVQRHSPPSREAGQNVAPTISARTKGGGGLGTDFDLDGGVIEATYAPEIARCVATREGSSQDYETTTMVAHAIQAGALRTNPNSGPDGVGVQANIAYTLEARAEVQAVSYRIAGDGAAYDEGDKSAPLTTGTDPNAHVIAFDTTQITSPLNRSAPKAGDACHPLSAGAHPPAIAWSIMPQNSGKDYKARQVDVAQPLMAGGPVGGNQGGDYIQQPVALTVALRGREGGATAELGGDVATALRASSGGGDKPHVLAAVAFAQQAGGTQTTLGYNPDSETTPTLSANQTPGVHLGSAVRRLTPTECERLQGFPDGYTDIPWRGKPTSPDGPRYKALGNSWAVPKFVWLGRRLAMHMPSAVAQSTSEAA